MARANRARRLLPGALFLGAAAAALGWAVAFSAPAYPPNATGYDISWPQCPANNPSATLDFAIVGVNAGKAMTQNPCFAGQVAWARKAALPPALYLNTNSPPANYTNPACRTSDKNCLNYRYGYDAAAYALSFANTAAPDVTDYWLDVETGNAWSTNKSLNARVLQGLIDYLKAHQKTVGIYSTSYQFGLIAGNFSPGLPNWVPGVAHGPEDGPAACLAAPSFGGGTVVMVQWTWTYDASYVCPPQVNHRISMPMAASESPE